MSELYNCQFFCLYPNSMKQTNNMKERFTRLGVNCNYYAADYATDIQQNIHDTFSGFDHLRMIYDFCHKTTCAYGVFCENDIYIHTDIKPMLPKILCDFNLLSLDILLLGYLTPFLVDESVAKYGFSLKRETSGRSKYMYHNYPETLIGAQMYILSRKHAMYILDKYYDTYIGAIAKNDVEHLSASNLLLTNSTSRALISPPLACVKDVNNVELHIKSMRAHYNKAEFI